MAGEALKFGIGVDLASMNLSLASAALIITQFADSTVASFNRVAKQFKDSGNFDTTIGQYRSLQFAADQTGTSMNTLEVAARRMESNIGKATFGGPQKKIFDKLHLSAVDLAKLDLPSQFTAISHAMEKVHNTSQRAAISMQLFGIAGTREQQFLRELAENTAKFEKLTGAISELDGAKIYGAVQALKEVHTIFNNIYDMVAAKVAPIVTNLIHKFEDLGFTGGNIKNYIDSAFESIVSFSIKTFGYVNAIYETMKFVGVRIYDFWSTIFSEIFKGMGEGFDRFRKVASVVSSVAVEMINRMLSGTNDFKNFVGPIFNGIANTIASTFYKAFMEVRGYLNTLISGFNSISPKKLSLIGAMTAPSLGSFVPSKAMTVSGIGDIAGDILGSLKLAFKASLGLGGVDVGGVFGKSLESSLKIAQKFADSVRGGDALKEAQKRVDEREKTRPPGDPDMSLGAHKPLGFGGRLDQYGGSIGNIINSMQRAGTKVQHTSDEKAHAILKAIEKKKMELSL